MFKYLRMIHYTAGLVGSIIVLLMAVTGILLNHRTLIGYSSKTSMRMQELIFALHSGNIGNTSIVWVTDLGAICMIVLSISGIWMWISFVLKIRKGKRRRNG
ncbi:PepSY domain-containing protein [Sporolactobacillus kofuensis]|uniref:PepSY domain-containing protein n=1 Tax=Sporolactobacillus kofuensis TaxID=269672 RepID=A0ABW1WCA8_9BACL|nr:PepSY domain-containing protein [Sporolactobacillus kofuensis]MCO7175490.1 PepSY domain-containing protein [Sporolactobacillus kofuensis]